MPNLNAALGCAQMEYLDDLLKIKKKIAYRWHQFFSNLDLKSGALKNLNHSGSSL